MTTATKKKPKAGKRYVQVIQEGWYAQGIYRRMGELLPVSGVNVGLMTRQGYLAPLEDEDYDNIRACDVEGCSTVMVRAGFDNESLGLKNLKDPKSEMTYPVERLTRKDGAGPRLFITQEALDSHKMQDHGMSDADLLPGGPPTLTADPGESAASGAAMAAASQPGLEAKRQMPEGQGEGKRVK